MTVKDGGIRQNTDQNGGSSTFLHPKSLYSGRDQTERVKIDAIFKIFIKRIQHHTLFSLFPWQPTAILYVCFILRSKDRQLLNIEIISVHEKYVL